MNLNVVIPAYNEAESLPHTLTDLHKALTDASIPHEIIIVNDHSTDNTVDIVKELSIKVPTVHLIDNPYSNGFGFTVRAGLEACKGDCIAIMMADMSDSPADLVRFYQEMVASGVDCVFGSRFTKGATVRDYPRIKLMLNRVANNLVRIVFGIKYNDVTNAFKLYRRSTIEGLKPFLSPQFNLTLELPLKAIVRGYSYRVLPNDWTNRRFGKSNLRIKEMGSRYFFIFLYCLIEKYFSKGDYEKPNT